MESTTDPPALAKPEARRGFGPDPLNPYGQRPAERVGGKTRKKLRDAVASACPRVPGVYGMFDDEGELIYIGKSLSLRNRLMSYFGEAARQEKGGRIVGMAKKIGWETQPNDFAGAGPRARLDPQVPPQNERPGDAPTDSDRCTWCLVANRRSTFSPPAPRRRRLAIWRRSGRCTGWDVSTRRSMHSTRCSN